MADNGLVASSSAHEALVQLFRNSPSLATALLPAELREGLPSSAEARVANAERTEMPPATYRADLVVELRVGARPAAAIVVEVQLGKDSGKRLTWPLYVASVRAELLLRAGSSCRVAAVPAADARVGRPRRCSGIACGCRLGLDHGSSPQPGTNFRPAV